MSTRTPGPWRIERDTYVDGAVYLIRAIGKERSIASVGEEANARLIAAAPELLEACQAVSAAMALGTYETAFQLVKAAIKKATEAP